MEKVTQKYSERDPELRKLKEEYREAIPSSFSHIGSTRNGSFTREWTARDFKDDIQLLRNPDTWLSAFWRTILRDESTMMQFVTRLHVNPEEYWEYDKKTYEGEIDSYEDYIKNHFYRSLTLDVEREVSLNEFSDNEILELLKIYNKEIEKIKITSLERIEVLAKDFIPRLKAISEKLSIDVNFDDIEFRFSNIAYNFFDSYNNKTWDNDHKNGDYDKDTHSVRVRIDEHHRFSSGTLQHEHLHAVSGQENEGMLRYFEGHGSVLGSSVERLGGLIKRINRRSDQFNWMNEAITQQINMEILKDYPVDERFELRSDSYDRERELFNLILKNGKTPINPKYFYQAYFESDTENPEDAVHRKTLFEEIKKAYGSPIFLVRLDDIIGEFGIIKGLEMFKESGKEGIEKFWRESFVKEEVLLQE